MTKNKVAVFWNTMCSA